MNKKQSILFLCTHNSARSQMAEGLMRHDFGDRFDVFSAGSEKTLVKPLAIAAMASLSIDISTQHSKTTDAFIKRPLDYVVSVCDHAREACPYIPAVIENIHQAFVDPSNSEGNDEVKLEAFIASAKEIRAWIHTRFGPIRSS